MKSLGKVTSLIEMSNVIDRKRIGNRLDEISSDSKERKKKKKKKETRSSAMSTAMLALSSNATRARVRVRVGGQCSSSSSSSSSSRVVLRRRSASNHLKLQRFTTTVTRAEDPKKEDVGGAEADEFLGGAMGKFISGLTEFAANSPINQGKM